jgi:hypothetical protein
MYRSRENKSLLKLPIELGMLVFVKYTVTCRVSAVQRAAAQHTTDALQPRASTCFVVEHALIHMHKLIFTDNLRPKPCCALQTRPEYIKTFTPDFRYSQNGGTAIDTAELIQRGSYNVLINDASYTSRNFSFEDSHDAFKEVRWGVTPSTCTGHVNPACSLDHCTSC